MNKIGWSESVATHRRGGRGQDDLIPGMHLRFLARSEAPACVWRNNVGGGTRLGRAMAQWRQGHVVAQSLAAWWSHACARTAGRLPPEHRPVELGLHVTSWGRRSCVEPGRVAAKSSCPRGASRGHVPKLHVHCSSAAEAQAWIDQASGIALRVSILARHVRHAG